MPGTDFPDQLMQAADNIDAVPRDELQVLLRAAAVMIRDLRALIEISDDIDLEDMPPQGRA